MKIGIATYFWEDIPGQYFQALATYNELKKQLPDANIEFINIKHWNHRWRPSFRLRKFIPSITKRLKYIEARSCFPLSKPSLLSTSESEIVNYINSKKYDLIIVGADVCLKPLPKFLGEQLPYYWIDEKIKTKKVMLASSSDITKIDGLSNCQIHKMKTVLKDFSYIGLRDSMTYDMIGSLGFKDRISYVPDPTFTLEINPEPAKALWRHLDLASDRPILGVNLPSTPLTKEIISSFRNDGFQIISIGSNNFLCGLWIDKLSLDEWSGIFKYLDIMLTVSFHESIFSLKNGTPVVAIDINDYRIDIETGRSKTYSLMKQFAMEKTHHVNPHRDCTPDKICKQIHQAHQEFNSAEVAAKIRAMAEQYRKMLKKFTAIIDIN